MLPNFLEEIADKVKPALHEATNSCTMYAERIISHLEEIVNAVQSDELLNVRKFPYVIVPVTGRQFIAEVPTDQDWVLEAVTLEADAATTVRLVDGSSANLAKWGATVAAAGITVYGGQGIVFPGGTAINAVNLAGNATLVMQFRFERKKAKNKASRAGMITQGADRLDSRNELQEDGRHLGTSHFSGENVRGERHTEKAI